MEINEINIKNIKYNHKKNSNDDRVVVTLPVNDNDHDKFLFIFSCHPWKGIKENQIKQINQIYKDIYNIYNIYILISIWFR